MEQSRRSIHSFNSQVTRFDGELLNAAPPRALEEKRQAQNHFGQAGPSSTCGCVDPADKSVQEEVKFTCLLWSSFEASWDLIDFVYIGHMLSPHDTDCDATHVVENLAAKNRQQR